MLVQLLSNQQQPLGATDMATMSTVPDIAALMRGPAGSHGGNGPQTDIATGMIIAEKVSEGADEYIIKEED